MRNWLTDLTALPELSQTEASKRIINPNILYTWVRSPDGKYYQVNIPVDLPAGTKREIRISWTTLTLQRHTANGYNSEYEITTSSGTPWIIIGTIFTTKNPLIQMMENKQTKLATIESAIAARSAELKKIKLEFWKLFKKNNRNNFFEVKNKLESLHTDEKNLINEINWLKSDIPSLPKYISFPYVPYQRALNVNDTHMAGIGHLGKIMTDAYAHLKAQWRMTVTEIKDGKEITRTIDTTDIHTKAPPVLAMFINIIERMDHMVYYKTVPEHTIEQNIKWKNWKIKKQSVPVPRQEVLRNTEEIQSIMKNQIERALTVFWLNEWDAYKWQRNIDSWALGIAQLIPSAYKNFQYKYSILQKESGIPTEHEIGAKDQRVAMQFQIMHLYDEYYQLPLWIRNDWNRIMSDRQAMIWLYCILAAGYNGSLKNTLTEAGLNAPWEHTLSELYPNILINKFKNNHERQGYAMKTKVLLEMFPPDKE